MKKLLVLLAAGALVVAACGDDDGGGDDTVTVTGAWARTSPMASDLGAAYLVIESPIDDRMIGASAPLTLAGRTEIHETVMMPPDDGMDGDGMHGDDTDGNGMDGNGMDGDDMHGDGMMTMRQVGHIDLPAGQPIALEPGGLHVMLIDLRQPLEAGDTFELRLSFAEQDPIDVTVEIRDEAP